MKILMIARASLYSSPGGDTTQILMTASYLRSCGVSVDISLSNSLVSYKDYDLIHFFNIIRPDDIIRHVENSNLPFVVSTIFVDYKEYEMNCRPGLIHLLFNIVGEHRTEYIKNLARCFFNGQKINSWRYIFSGQKSSVRWIIKRASLLLPNSNSEYSRLFEKFGVDARYNRVVNAVDSSVFHSGVDGDPDFKDHVLCVGRIEGRKNQLNLIKALIGTGLKLTIIGKPSPNHLGYFNKCKALASQDKNIAILEHIDHSNLPKIYRAAKVHVLPSWFETTGLSSLEAGAMGCNLVITDKGDTREYFADMAYYCDPSDTASIRKAVLNAHIGPAKPELKKLILENYTWDKAAKQTCEAYLEVLNRGGT